MIEMRLREGPAERSAPVKEEPRISQLQRKDETGAAKAEPHGRLYTYAVETAATIAFWTPVAMAQEVLVAGLTVKQSLEVRGISAVLNLAVARPYGIYRDWAFKFLRTDEKSNQKRRFWTDYVAFSTFWTPLYIGMIASAGGDHKQIMKAIGIGFVTNLVTGRPFGAYFDFVRRKAGLKSAWQTGPAKTDNRPT